MHRFMSDIVIDVAKEISAHGGRAYLVGGIPRDCVVTNNHHHDNWRNVVNMSGSDVDIEVFGMGFVILENLITPFFSSVDLTGKRFGVLIATYKGKKFDFSIAKRERQVGIGHQGFEYEFDPNMTIEQACMRRDYTINSMAIDPITSELIDPLDGIIAIRERLLIACNEDSFSNDPLRIMRGMQMCGRFSLRANNATKMDAIVRCASKFNDLSREAVWGEMKKWALKSVKPSLGLVWLGNIGWIDDIPILGNYHHIEQDRVHHPEGNLLFHTLYAVDHAAKIAYRENLNDFDKLTLIFAALLHDCGKINTTETDKDGRITTYGHDVESGYLAEKWFFEYMNEPDRRLREHVVVLVSNHMAHIRNRSFTRKAVRKLSRKIQPSNLKMLAYLMECDYSARPPLEGGIPNEAVSMLILAHEEDIAESAVKPILMGRHLINIGLEPSPLFGEILNKALEAQINEEFFNILSASEWLMANQKELGFVWEGE